MHTSRILRYKNRTNIIGMAGELLNTLSCAGIPHVDGAFRTARDNRVPVRVDRKRIYQCLGARCFRWCESYDRLRCCRCRCCLRGTGEIPKLDCASKGARCDPALITAATKWVNKVCEDLIERACRRDIGRSQRGY